MTSAARVRGGALYTPEILAAATRLAAFPWDEGLALRGEARSRSCGSSIVMALSTNGQGVIDAVAIRPHACAVGQAAASLFAQGAAGRNRDEIDHAREQIARWLADGGPQPDWPGIALLEPAIAYPARHAAILLGWDAALAALTSENR